jgi:ADP-ribose 1''-phosphate phosphatase
MSRASIVFKNLPTVAKAVSNTPKPAVKMVYGGDLFTAPANSILIRKKTPTLFLSLLLTLTKKKTRFADACNTRGSWRSGVAAAFKEKYPGAHKVYVSVCAQEGESLAGKTLLIPPQAADAPRQHWIGCLFTSVAYGKAVDPPEVVLRHTKTSMEDLLRQVKALEDNAGKDKPGEWHSAKINSVRFKVPWEETVKVIEDVLKGTEREVVVYEYDEAKAGGGGGGH